MEGIDWRALLVKVQQYIIYFVPFFLIGLALEAGLNSLLSLRLGANRFVKAWIAAWDSPMFGGSGEQGAQPWWYHAMLAFRTVAGPLALILAWRWSGSLFWLRLVGGLLVTAALLLVLSRTRRVRVSSPPRVLASEDALPAPALDEAQVGRANLRAAVAAGKISDTPRSRRPVVNASSSAAAVAPSMPINPLRRLWRVLDNLLAIILGHRFDWLGLKAAIVLVAGGFIALILPYHSGADFFGGSLPILLLPLAGYFLPTSGGAEMAVVIVLGSKGLSLGAALAFILASPLIYRSRLEEVELLNGKRAMIAYGLVAWLLPVGLGLVLYFLFPDKLLLKCVSVAEFSCNLTNQQLPSLALRVKVR
ncbi:MAG: hypothetical protein DLM69_06445 [Candidatus Chloroheliales bacterium]|nr:MAG: hypothetical protein DLM69_06445 [Chloroflexota bacterium]